MSRIKRIIRKTIECRRNSILRKNIINKQHDVNEFKVSTLADCRKQGFSFSESAIYDLQTHDWHNYISTWESYQPREKSNKYFCISDDKYLFSLVFSNFVKVPKTLALIQNGNIISISTDICSVDSLIRYIIQNNGCVIKDRGGCDGFNVFVIHYINHSMVYKEKNIDKRGIEDIIKHINNGLIQEIIEQGNFGKSLFPNSVNTIRLISVRKQNDIKHEIIASLQRIGTQYSAPVDNFNQGGLSSLIDVETGVLGKATGMKAIDENGERVFYEKHPDTGMQIEGIVIPCWNELKNSIIEVTEKLPLFDYIAWDIALQDDGFTVIEINMKSSLNVFQIHGGMRNSLLGEKYREHGFLVDDEQFLS